MYTHTIVVYKIHEFSSYALKNRIYFELHVRHEGDNAPFHKVLTSRRAVHKDAGTSRSTQDTWRESRPSTTKMFHD